MTFDHQYEPGAYGVCKRCGVARSIHNPAAQPLVKVVSAPHMAEVSMEDVAIAAVMYAAHGAFDPLNERELTAVETVQVCHALVNFLKFAEGCAARSLAEWRVSIENLNFNLGKQQTC